MTPEQKKVLEFHYAMGLTVNTSPKSPYDLAVSDRLLRIRLIMEEFMEFYQAETAIEIADALGDLLYVVYGAAITYGVDMEEIFNEIHRSNMTKIWPDGTVKKDPGGKVIKPPTYSPANLTYILHRHFHFPPNLKK